MNKSDVLAEFEAAGALQKGHFILSSGLHSDTYLNKSIVSMYPERTERLCRALAAKARKAFDGEFEFVVSPAMGAIIYGYETARHLGVPFMFVERVDGAFQLRRGFSLKKGARVLVVEDIVSTGLSARECIAAVRALGAEVAGLACLIDRSGGAVDVGAPLTALAELDVKAWPPDALPEHLSSIPALKPGSRGVSQ
ncbi:MAG: orotate phosphoribosyltransferase [Parvularculaceae bacterium]